MLKNFSKKSLAILLLTLFAGLCFAICGQSFTAKATDESLKIRYNNLAFQDNVYILYAVESEGIDNVQDIQLLVWDTPQEEYVYGTQDHVLTYYATAEINGQNYPVFVLSYLSAKQMTDEVFAVAYYDGNYSAPNKYSILQYATNKLKTSSNEKLKNLLSSMLTYGANAQIYYDYKLDTLANDTYYTVQVENCLLADGFTKGLYKSGTEITVTAEIPENAVFEKWTDSEDNVIGTDETLTITVDKDITIHAEYLIPTADEYFTFTLLSNDTYEIQAKDVNNMPAEVVLPSTYNGKAVTSIGDRAFYYCRSLTSITFGETSQLTSIGNWAFEGCSKLTSITIPDSVTSIGNGAFASCRKLTSITIPDSVTSIGYRAFYNCSSLSEITIPDSVTSIGERVFDSCSSLTSITIGGSVTSIGDDAFIHCSSLTSITIGGSVTSIGGWAFCDCSSLTSITIPDSVTSIGYYAFGYCSSLTSITVDENNGYYKSIDGNLYTKDGKTFVLYAPGKTATEFTIPDSVTSIGDGAFSGCSGLSEITIPDSVTSIGQEAFYNCSSLTSVYFTGSIDEWCEISFGNAVANPLYYAKNLYIDNELVTTVNITTATKINSYAFEWCSSLTSITIPDSVTSIGSNAFSYCSSLTSITIPDSVTSIGIEAFRACKALSEITIPDSVTSIGDYAFEYCSSLTTVYYKGTAEEWGNISIGSYNSALTNATRYYYSENYPENFVENTYWHYVDGVPTVWVARESNNVLYTRVNVDCLADENGDYILFGEYPQSEVTDSGLKTTLNTLAGTLPTNGNNGDWTSYKYYINGSNDADFMWYKDVDVDDNGTKDYRAVYFTSYRPYWTGNSSSAGNTYQDDNGYNVSNVYWFKYEPIKWRILSEEDGTALILAELILDSQDYNYTYQSRNIDGKTVYINNYEYSSIRAWLNENFYNTAFNELQQEIILTTTVDNSARSTNPDNNGTRWNNGVNNYACNDTEDKIFLLSQQEVTTAEYGFDEEPGIYGVESTRIRKTSDYAQVQGVYTHRGDQYDGNGYWWLRSPHYYEVNNSWFVFADGNSDFNGYVYSTLCGVVPALQITLEQK